MPEENEDKKITGAVVKKTEDKGSLASFFQSVSDSVINAQKELNKQSLEYIKNLKGPIQPSYFAIPRVNAEMRMAVSDFNSEQLNILVKKKTQSTEEVFESTISFDVVSAPPPPSFTNPIIPFSYFLLLGEERAEFLKQFLELKEVIDQVNKSDDKKNRMAKYKDTESDMLILRNLKNEDSRFKENIRYMVIWPARGVKNKNAKAYNELMIFNLYQTDKGLVIDNKIFRSNPLGKKFLHIPAPGANGELDKLTKDKLQELTLALSQILIDLIFEMQSTLKEVSKGDEPPKE